MSNPTRARASLVALAVVVAIGAAAALVLLAPPAPPPGAPGSGTAPGAEIPGPDPAGAGATTLPDGAPTRAPAGIAKATVPAERADLLVDQYWGTYVGGNKTGYLRVLATRAQRDGKPVIELREEHYGRSHSKIAEKTRESRTEVRGILDEDLSVIEFVIETRELERVASTRVHRDGNGYEVVTELDGKRTVRRVDGSGPVCGSWDLLLMRLAREGRLRPDAPHRFLEFDLGVPRAVEKTIHTRAVLDPSPAGREAFRVEFDVVQATLDARGVVAHGRMGGTELRATTETDAKAFDGDAVAIVRDDLNIDFNFPRWGALDEVVLSVVVEGDEDGDIFQESEYQKVAFRSASGSGIYTLTLQPYRLREAAKRSETEPPCDLAEFLEPTPMEQCDDPMIISKAKEIAGDLPDALEQVRAISRWVNTQLDKRYTEIAGLSASETLREMAGDCSEHAVLFNALTRALGHPVRQCSGFVFLGEIGGRHAWSQVLIDGRWIHVDTVLDSVGADPRYILFYEHRPGHERDLTYDRRMTHLTTHPARATVESFRIFGRSWTPAEARGAAKAADGRYDNPILGLSFPLPEGWKAGSRVFSLTTAQFRSGPASFEMRVLPYRFEALKQYPWMFGLTGNAGEWEKAAVGNREGRRAATEQGARRQLCWAIEFEDGVLVLQYAGPAEGVAGVEKALASLVLLEPGPAK